MSLEQILNLLEHTSATLAAQGAQNDSEELGVFGFLDLLVSNLAHLLRMVDLMCDLLLERVVLEEL